MSSYLMGHLPPSEHANAILDMVEWWGEMGSPIPLSVVAPSKPSANGLCHIRLTRNCWSGLIPGWNSVANTTTMMEWMTPNFPKEENGEMWVRDRSGWERMIDPHRAKFDLNKIKQSDYTQLIEQAASVWLAQDHAHLIMLNLHTIRNNEVVIDKFDLSRWFFDRTESHDSDLMMALRARKPNNVAHILFDLLGVELPPEPYSYVNFSLNEPSPSLVSERLASRLAMQTQEVLRPSMSRRI